MDENPTLRELSMFGKRCAVRTKPLALADAARVALSSGVKKR
ncbi:MAG TPA: hypothetical protein VK604_00425 [Bryobacteraceae bacterium]|nr:hypothetical protein [Bryobacteraceae bacterium]